MKTGNTNKWTADSKDLKTINIYKNKLPRGGVHSNEAEFLKLTGVIDLILEFQINGVA